MTTGWLVFVLGILLGLGFGLVIGRVWGYRNGHHDGYQDHRAEVADRKNAADLAAAEVTGAELELRAKTGPMPVMRTLPDLLAYEPLVSAGRWDKILAGEVPGGGRRFPTASPRTHTAAADIGPVVMPGDEGPGLASITGPMRTLSDEAEDIIQRIRAGTWP